MGKIGFLLSALVLLSAKQALAFCPVCAIAAGAGVGVAREFGVDDFIVGLWLGGLMVALIAWTIEWLAQKKWVFKYYQYVVGIVFYAITFIPLYFMNIIQKPLKLFDQLPVDKIILGSVLGSFLFWFAGEWYQALKKNNNNKAYFPYQKVIMPLGALILSSVLFYFLIK
ncbi:MAG: hypothetical protein PHR00_02910 [Patescibacteria group bacterium]|nr:hypothetical protein [Patescibacteria group bacterium]